MAFIPPACDAIDFEHIGMYTPPACDMLNFDIGGTAPYQILSEASDVVIESPSAEYFQGAIISSDGAVVPIEFGESLLDIMVPIGADAVQIPLEFEGSILEILPDIVTSDVEVPIEADHMVIRGTEEQHLPTSLDPGFHVSWEKEIAVDKRMCLPAGDGEHQIIIRNISWMRNTPPDPEIQIPWLVIPYKDHWINSVYADFPSMDHIVSSSWIGMMDYLDWHIAKSWNTADEHQLKFCTSYNEPGANDTFKQVLWDTADEHQIKFCASYNAPSPNDEQKCVPWGPYSYYTLCFDGTYRPPLSCGKVPFAFPNKYPMHDPDICSEIRFELNDYTSSNYQRCPYHHWHSGDRDKYPGIILPPPSEFPRPQKVYYMLNSVLVKEYLTNTPIQVLGVSMTIDRSSWLWQFQVTVASKDCLDIIKPQDGVFINIVIELNGYQWLCTVESWQENRAFGKDAWTITGRSPSLIFGDPMDPKKTDTVNVGKSGYQLLEDVVAAKVPPASWPGGAAHPPSWTSDWTSYDSTATGFDPVQWFVPAGTLSYTDQTSIDIMKTVAGSIGAYIQTDPSEHIFHVKPIYAYQPWNWETESAIDWNHVIEDQFIEIGRNYELRSDFRAVHVMGESIANDGASSNPDPNGEAVFVNVCRDGWCSGSSDIKYGPMITDKLITDSKSGLERGRMFLGDTGEWVKHTLKLSVLCPAGTGLGLFKPGDMIRVLERGVVWSGQVTSTNISAANAGNGFTVQQIIGVEQYIGD
jgi:hypothetical protein